MSLNQRYLRYLQTYPLLTKSTTAGVLAALNEVIASAVSGDFKTTRIGSKNIRHVFSSKILSMVFYGALVVTPISHTLYKILNKVFSGKLSPSMKLAQLATSLCTISPVLSAAYVSWLSLINGYSKSGLSLAALAKTVQAGLRSNFLPVYKTSILTLVVAMTVAQNFLPPQLWVVFFSVVYFVVGTVQNTRFKLKQKQLTGSRD